MSIYKCMAVQQPSQHKTIINHPLLLSLLPSKMRREAFSEKRVEEEEEMRFLNPRVFFLLSTGSLTPPSSSPCSSSSCRYASSSGSCSLGKVLRIKQKVEMTIAPRETNAAACQREREREQDL